MGVYLLGQKKVTYLRKTTSIVMTIALLCNSFLFLLPQLAQAETLSGYRWRSDNGTEVSATWQAAENTPIALTKGEGRRLRFGVAYDTGTRPGAMSRTDTFFTGDFDKIISVGAVEDGTYIYNLWSDSPWGAYSINIDKIRKSDLAVVDTYTPGTAVYNSPGGLAIDSGGNYLYFTASDASGSNSAVVRLLLSDFSTASQISMGSGGNWSPQTVDIDPSDAFAYVTEYDSMTSTPVIHKINLSSWTDVGTMTWASGTYGYNFKDGVIDSTGSYLYLRTNGGGSYYINKLDLSSFGSAPTGSITLNGSQPASDYIAIDSAGSNLYYTSNDGGWPATGLVGKVATSTMTLVGSVYSLTDGNIDPNFVGVLGNGDIIAVNDDAFGVNGTIVSKLDGTTFTLKESAEFDDGGFPPEKGSSAGYVDVTNNDLYITGGDIQMGEGWFGKMNLGSGVDTSFTYQIEYGAKSSTCGAISSWSAVAADDSGSEHWAMNASGNITNGSATTNVAGGVTDGAASFVAGYIMDTAAITPAITMTTGEFTEVEYSIAATDDATAGGDYCFRITDGGNSTGFTFNNYAEASLYGGTEDTVGNAYRWRDDNGTEVTADWLAGENNPITGLNKETTTRLRLGVSNEGEWTGLDSYVAESDQRRAAGIVDDGTYLYYVWTNLSGSEAISITKVQKSNMTEVDQYDFPTTIGLPSDVAYVQGHEYIYIAAEILSTNVNVLIKFDLSTFNSYSTQTYGTQTNSGFRLNNVVRTVDIDPGGSYVYLSVSNTYGYVNGTVYKVDTTTLTTVDSISTAYGTYGNAFWTGDISDAGDYLYYATQERTSAGDLDYYNIKIPLGTFGLPVAVDVLDGNDDYYPRESLVVESAGDYLYYVIDENENFVNKVRTSDMALVDTLTMPTGIGSSGYSLPMDIDDTNDVLYFIEDRLNGTLSLFAVNLDAFEVYGDMELGSSLGNASHIYVDDAGEKIYAASLAYSGSGEFWRADLIPDWTPAPRLEYGVKSTTCAAISSWTQVPASASGGEHWEMSTSSNFTSGDPTTNVSNGVTDGSTTFTGGEILDATSQATEITWGEERFTELEFSLEATPDAIDGGEYCFRLSDAGSMADFNFTNYPEAELSGGGPPGPPGITEATLDTVYTTMNRPHLDRLQVGEDRVHFTLSFELAGASGPSDQLSIVFPAGFANLDAGSASATCSGGGTISNWQTDGLNAWADKSNCVGTVEVEGIYVDLPDAVGAYVIEWSNDNGSGAVYIMDDDQVTVLSDVDPILHFDIDTSTNNATTVETAAPYGVDFGTLDASETNVSGEAGINYIMLDLDTNATHGAIITVRNANGTAGLVSASTPTDSIANAAAAMASGSENYGFCVQAAATELGEAIYADGDYSTGTCADQADGNDVEELTTADKLIFTVDGPTYQSRTTMSGSASIDVLTEAHDDYQDVLTFIATSTF